MPFHCALDNADDRLGDEQGRLFALQRAMILDTRPETSFDKITTMVQTVLNVPIAAISLVDRDRQWFKSKQGVKADQTPIEQSFCSHTIRKREPMVIPDATLDPRFVDNPLVTGQPFIRSYAGAPLISPEGYNLGALCAIDVVPRHFQSAHIDLLTNFAALVVDEMELRLIALTDYLTGALTRRAFMAEIDRALARFARSGDRSALLILDIDRFKRINDALSHAVGDRVLQAVSSCCVNVLRSEDSFGRIGGEEFCLLLPSADTFQASRVAERMRKAIAELAFPDYPELKVTASFGVSILAGETTAASWMAQADQALYAAKQSGRNRWCLAA
jgi:diguanylate cyclase (GGDEF)-like protein